MQTNKNKKSQAKDLENAYKNVDVEYFYFFFIALRQRSIFVYNEIVFYISHILFTNVTSIEHTYIYSHIK